MQLCNLKIIGSDELVNIEVSGEKIKNITGHFTNKNITANGSIFFDDAIAFPGLINSHDHLDFNLFPQIANRVYHNYKEWGEDIHVSNKELIRCVLKIPQPLRTEWGLYKNLLNGITTVVNHGERLHINNEVISVLQNNYSIHSVQFEKKWKLKLNNPFKKNQPFVIHIGEGTDNASHEEINSLIRWNLFKRKIVAVHGVAMDEEQAEAFHALVWCPASNNFMLDASAPIDELKIKTPILFGTDSTLTASWNLWDHLRSARDTILLTDRELFDSLTTAPAAMWRQKNIGTLAINKTADICVACANNKKSFEAFYSINPGDLLLVMHKGKIRLFDEILHDKLTAAGISLNGYSRIRVDNNTKYVYGDIPGLMKKIASYYPGVHFPISLNKNQHDTAY
ncbi:MAG: hypothetical protein ABI472_20740 [Ginsengibacter sp.]